MVILAVPSSRLYIVSYRVTICAAHVATLKDDATSEHGGSKRQTDLPALLVGGAVRRSEIQLGTVRTMPRHKIDGAHPRPTSPLGRIQIQQAAQNYWPE